MRVLLLLLLNLLLPLVLLAEGRGEMPDCCRPPIAAEARLRFALALPDGRCLALVEEAVETRSVAAIWRLDEGWQRLAGEGLALDGYGWVGAVAAGAQVIALADSVVEGPGLSLTALSSHDGGRTWGTPQSIPTPYYMAYLLSLRIESDGSARLTMGLEEDFGSGVATGTYCYTAAEDGSGWSGPHGPFEALADWPC